MGAATIDMTSKIDDRQANWAIGSTYCQAMHLFTSRLSLKLMFASTTSQTDRDPFEKKKWDWSREGTKSHLCDGYSTGLLVLWEEGAEHDDLLDLRGPAGDDYVKGETRHERERMNEGGGGGPLMRTVLDL